MESNEVKLLQEIRTNREQSILTGPISKIRTKIPILSALFFIAGLVSLYLYPDPNYFANRTYLSENALSPGIAGTHFSEENYNYAIKLEREYSNLYRILSQEHNRDIEKISKGLMNWVNDKIQSLGLEVYKQHYNTSVIRPDGVGTNVIGIVRAGKTAGREVIVLSSKNYLRDIERNIPNSISGISLGISILKYLSEVNWLSKDIMFVVTETIYNDVGITTWNHRYHNVELIETDDFVRGGKIRAAVCLDFRANSLDYILLKIHGSNGKLPNLDLVNTFEAISQKNRRQTNIFDFFDPIPDLLFIKKRFGEFIDSFNVFHKNLIIFILRQAFGVPTGDHAAFQNYNVDAITITCYSNQQNDGTMFEFAHIIESGVRSLNNLIEHFHQSFYYYILVSPYIYISIGQYMITLAFLIIPLLLLIFYILSDITYTDVARGFFRMIALYTTGFLYYMSYPLHTKSIEYFWIGITLHVVVAVILAKLTNSFFFKLFILNPKPDQHSTPKVMCRYGTSVGPLICFISCVSVVNFSFAVISALLTVPTFIIKPVEQSKSFTYRFIRNFIQFSILISISLPAILYYISLIFPQFSYFDIWQLLLQQHLTYGTLIFPFFCVIYFPSILSHLFLFFNI
eukprot:TRINITY_DN3852_c0_g1_i1.p1 TRINITY_DN3852_c0_g1~~TRINITY_DN3852_c0_g1_i1.p1  ORF type:complete len:627 (+),score=109.34 TRINITY_DN3852_c0_g1_i1:99-1979(+)